MHDGLHAFPEAEPGDHIIVIYRDDAELFGFLVQFVGEGLANRERCVCVVAEAAVSGIISALSAGGVQIPQETKRTALALMSSREFFGYALEAVVSQKKAPRAIDVVRARLKEAVSARFTGLRVAIDMASAVGPPGPEGDVEVGEFQALLERITGPGRATVAFLHQEDRFDPAFLERLVRTHPKVFAHDYVYLRLSALFRSLARKDLGSLSQSASERIVRKGGFFFRQGDSASEVFFLTAGRVKLVHTDAEGRSVILRIVAPMGPFGERVFAIGGSVRPASAEALQDSRALAWDGTTLLRIILAHPEVSKSAISLLEERIEVDQSRLGDFVSPDVGRRLARLLLRLSQHLGRRTRHGSVIPVPLSRRDLAELTITSPYSVSRTLAEWRRLDIVDAQRTQIVIRDPQRLAAMVRRRTAH